VRRVDGKPALSALSPSHWRRALDAVSVPLQAAGPDARAGIYAPYQPRFEWNLWLASLGEWRAYPWVVRTELRLLEGSPAVLRLFAGDPFANEPPSWVRAVRWQYWFTTPDEKRATGAWWKREERGLYAPELHSGVQGVEVVGPTP
jgi:lipase maturation factor